MILLNQRPCHWSCCGLINILSTRHFHDVDPAALTWLWQDIHKLFLVSYILKSTILGVIIVIKFMLICSKNVYTPPLLLLLLSAMTPRMNSSIISCYHPTPQSGWSCAQCHWNTLYQLRSNHPDTLYWPADTIMWRILALLAVTALVSGMMIWWVVFFS